MRSDWSSKDFRRFCWNSLEEKHFFHHLPRKNIDQEIHKSRASCTARRDIHPRKNSRFRSKPNMCTGSRCWWGGGSALHPNYVGEIAQNLSGKSTKIRTPGKPHPIIPYSVHFIFENSLPRGHKSPYNRHVPRTYRAGRKKMKK